MPAPQQFSVALERHHPDLPMYLMVPNAVADVFGKPGTFVVEATINDSPIGRRSIKPWGDGRWFMELTKVQCARLQVREGDSLQVELRIARELPPELAARLSDQRLHAGWAALSAAQRRAVAEHIFAAKKEKTRMARVEAAVARLNSRGD